MTAYFSYGSNMSQENMDRFCKRIGRPLIDIKTRNPRPAILKGYKLDFDVYAPSIGGGAANIEVSPGDHVEGTVFDMTDADMVTMDAKESTPDRYIRIIVSLQLRDGTELNNVVTYTAKESIKGPFCPPPRGYKRDVVEGAKAMGLSPAWIKMLESLPEQPGN